MIHHNLTVKDSRVLILGITFKENCPDIRNSKVIDIIQELLDFHVQVDVWDPAAYPEDVKKEYNITLVEQPQANTYDGIILTVKHSQFVESGVSVLKKFGKENTVFYDVKEVLK